MGQKLKQLRPSTPDRQAWTSESAHVGYKRPREGPFVSHILCPHGSRGPGRARGWRAIGSALRYWTQGTEGLMAAKGSAEWKGDLRSGAGTFTAGDSISGGYTFKSRFEDGPGSNPEQLIAAAHASCFSMALSNRLAEAGHTAQPR